jgi:hypothetical protein
MQKPAKIETHSNVILWSFGDLVYFSDLQKTSNLSRKSFSNLTINSRKQDGEIHNLEQFFDGISRQFFKRILKVSIYNLQKKWKFQRNAPD